MTPGWRCNPVVSQRSGFTDPPGCPQGALLRFLSTLWAPWWPLSVHVLRIWSTFAIFCSQHNLFMTFFLVLGCPGTPRDPKKPWKSLYYHQKSTFRLFLKMSSLAPLSEPSGLTFELLLPTFGLPGPLLDDPGRPQGRQKAVTDRKKTLPNLPGHPWGASLIYSHVFWVTKPSLGRCPGSKMTLKTTPRIPFSLIFNNFWIQNGLHCARILNRIGGTGR